MAGNTREMLSARQIADAALRDWRKLGQGLHARFVVADFTAGVRFLAAIAQAGDAAAHHPQVGIASTFVDLKLITDDALYRDESGGEHRVEWTTEQDVELARRISAIADDQELRADPGSITAIELALDTAHSDLVAPVWSALLTGGVEALGRGTISDDVRDPTGRVPILWFQRTDEHETPRQRFHIDVQVPWDVVEQRIAAAVAAGARIVDDHDAPWTTILADRDGNRACVGTFQPPPAA